MRKILSILLLAVLAVLPASLTQSCGKIDEQIDELYNRVDALENEKLVSLSEQIAGIESSISDLEKLKAEIAELVASFEARGVSISALQEADATLSERIDALQSYTDGKLTKYAEKDIVAATYATLAQYNATGKAISTIAAKVGSFDEGIERNLKSISDSVDEWTAQLADAIRALTGRIESFEQMVQSLTLIPAYSDGSLKTKDGILTVNCIVKPSSAAASLTKDNFTLLVNRIHFHVASMSSLIISDDRNFAKDTLSGIITLQADISKYTPVVGDTLAVAVGLKTEISDVTTKFARVAFSTPAVGGNFNVADAQFCTVGDKSHWELFLKENGNQFPTLLVITGSAYSKDFLEGNFDIVSAVYRTSESESTEYTRGSMTVSRASADNCYDFTGIATDENFTEFNFKAANVSVTAVKAESGTPITLQDKAADDPARIAVTGITLNSTSAQVPLNGSFAIVATVFPSNATNSNVVWSSSDSRIADVDADGLVKGLSFGTVTITATTVDGGKSAECLVNVKAISVTGVILDRTEVEIFETGTLQLTPTVCPNEATNKNVIWSSSNPAVATVDNSGKVTGLAEGTAVITVTTAGGNKKATCTVTVKHLIIEESVSVEPDDIAIGIGEGQQLSANVLPADASMKNVEWTSDNPDVASVDADGVVTGKALGTATITATTAHGRTAICNVTVQLPTGALPGKFSVSATKKVHFSKGNLLATVTVTNAASNWRFHEHQYDFCSASELRDTERFGGDKDIFRWSNTAIYSNWGLNSGNSSPDFIQREFKDWGNTIDNKGTWRTLSADEWDYLLSGRENAAQKVGRAEVCGKYGIVLLPDEFTSPAGTAFVSGAGQPFGYGNNEYDAAQWQAMEQAGAVFLPCAVYDPYSATIFGTGRYWTSTPLVEYTVFAYAAALTFGERYILADRDDNYTSCVSTYAVRLVTDSK